MSHHNIPSHNWTQHLARALYQAQSGDVLVVHSYEVTQVAESIRREMFPDKEIGYVIHRTQTRHASASSVGGSQEVLFEDSASVEYYVRQRTLEGNPPGPDEVQRRIDLERQSMERTQALQEWFGAMLQEFLGSAEEMGGDEVPEVVEALVREMSYNLGACIHTASKYFLAKGIHPEGFLKRLQQTVDDNMAEGLRKGYNGD